MKILVTGSAGHLGEALMRSFRASGDDAVGLDLIPSPFTDHVGSIADGSFVKRVADGYDVIIHAATLHKPHVGTHSRQDFVDTNVSGTLNLLEVALQNRCRSFIFTSTTSSFGDAMKPAIGEPAVWVTEDLRPRPRNIYGVTKSAAEDLCQLFSRNTGLPCIILKTSRFFMEEDDKKSQRDQFTNDNIKVNEMLFRRADIADIVVAHRLAIERASEIVFDKFIISATTPFKRDDAAELGRDASAVLARYFPDHVDEYERRGWKMFEGIDRVYDNARARERLGWAPEFSFERALEQLMKGKDYRSELSLAVGKKPYHSQEFSDGPYPVTGF